MGLPVVRADRTSDRARVVVPYARAVRSRLVNIIEHDRYTTVP